MPSERTAREAASSDARQPERRLGEERFDRVLFGRNVVDIDELRKQLWLGVPDTAPPTVRAVAWQTVLGYLPVQRERCALVLEKKRKEYFELARVRTILILSDLPTKFSNIVISTELKQKVSASNFVKFWWIFLERDPEIMHCLRTRAFTSCLNVSSMFGPFVTRRVAMFKGLTKY
eukprot:GHVN01055088.1.p1 GENE.GHVN01055088.1~~GHVN01055088.1.p1  ORF type:complete len:176 (+),score=9.43 GHVN01055088.1:579-1106(+)